MEEADCTVGTGLIDSNTRSRTVSWTLVELMQAIQGFTGGGPDEGACFELVRPHVEKFLHDYLARYVRVPQDRDDVVSTVLMKLWSQRSRLVFESAGAWWAYVVKVARHTAVDLGRVRAPESAGILEDIPQQEIPFVSLIAQRNARTEIHRAADELWLGEDPSVSPRQRKAKVLALQLWLLHKQSVDEVCALMGDMATALEVKAWLQDAAAHSQLCYTQLYYPNDALAAYLLDASKPPAPARLQTLGREAVDKCGPSPFPDWTWQEVRVVLWRYRNGLLLDKILQMSPDLTKDEVERTLSKCQAKLPFCRTAQTLLSAFLGAGWTQTPLSQDSLYRRLVFQYWIAYELPHKQIIERVEAPARLGQCKVTEMMLNGWLSNERLLRQLIGYIQRRSHGSGT